MTPIFPLRGGPVTLSDVTVRGLFGRFNHRIALHKNERITIMTAPNGFGKTTILRIIHALFSQRLRRLAAIPFREVSARFDGGYRLRVTRASVASDALKSDKPTLTLRLYKGRRLEEEFTLPRFSTDDFPYSLGLIDEWIPALDRVAPRLWHDVETGETLNLTM